MDRDQAFRPPPPDAQPGPAATLPPPLRIHQPQNPPPASSEEAGPSPEAPAGTVAPSASSGSTRQPWANAHRCRIPAGRSGRDRPPRGRLVRDLWLITRNAPHPGTRCRFLDAHVRSGNAPRPLREAAISASARSSTAGSSACSVEPPRNRGNLFAGGWVGTWRFGLLHRLTRKLVLPWPCRRRTRIRRRNRRNSGSSPLQTCSVERVRSLP